MNWTSDERRSVRQSLERIAEVLEERLPPLSEANDNEFLKRQIRMAREREEKLMALLDASHARERELTAKALELAEAGQCEHIDAEDAEREIESLNGLLNGVRSAHDKALRENAEMKAKLSAYVMREKAQMVMLRRALLALPQQKDENQEKGFPIYEVRVSNELLINARDALAAFDKVEVSR